MGAIATRQVSSHLRSRQLLVTAAFTLGLLCQHVVGRAPASDLTANDHLKIHGSRWRRTALADKASPLVEQAFEATFTSQDADEIQNVLRQYDQLAEWVGEHRKPSASDLAYLPELGSDAALQIMQKVLRFGQSSSKAIGGLTGDLRDISSKLRAASPRNGFPATRRLLIGALLKKRTELGGKFPSSLQPAVEEALVQLFRLHQMSVATRGAVQFFHISKSGGTNLCQAAEANGCTSQGFDTKTNCLIRDFFDQPRWVTYTAHKYVQCRMSSRQALPWFVNFHTFRPPYTCEQRRAYLLRENLTFYANEYANPPGVETSSEMCPDFVNLIMFRHPHDRLRSQIGWVQKLYKEFYLDVDTQLTFLNRTTGFWERLMPAGVNNYYVRSLLGQRFFEFPILQVAPEHITLAKLATLQHDILLTLESMARNELALRMGLGWSQALKDGAVRSSSELGDVVALPLDYDAMLERNAPDVEVFTFARAMQALDTVLWNFIAAATAVPEPKPASSAAAQVQQQLARLANNAAAGKRAHGSSSGSSGSNSSSGIVPPGRCGFVSLGPPEAVAELQKRLHDVEIPPSLWRAGGITLAWSNTSLATPGGEESVTSPAAGAGAKAASRKGKGSPGADKALRGQPAAGTTGAHAGASQGAAAQKEDEMEPGEAAWLAGMADLGSKGRGSSAKELKITGRVSGGRSGSASSANGKSRRQIPSVVELGHRRKLLRLKGGYLFGRRHQQATDGRGGN